MDVTPSVENPLDLAPNGKSRGIALLRFFAFLTLGLILSAGSMLVAIKLLKLKIDPDAVPSVKIFLIAQLASALLLVVAPTAIMVLACREPASRFGWGRSDRLRHTAVGLASGFGLMTAMLAIMVLMGGYSFGVLTLTPVAAMKYGFLYMIVFVLTAIAEEGLLRGYGFVQLSRAISFWPAAIGTSLVFLLFHMHNRGETPSGLASVGVAGLVLAYSFRRSGALWFALGFHAAWDYAETFFYGVPDSGLVAPHALMRPIITGPEWMTGGSAGPEGSLLVFPALAALAVIAHISLTPKPTTPAA